MKLNSKRYKIIKTKNYLKNNNLFLFFSGINQNSTDWIKIEQKLKNLNLNYYKIFNRTSTQILKNSIFINTEPTINGITFFIKPANSNTTISKKKISNIETFKKLAIKFNNRVYSANQLKYVSFLDYYNNKLLLYQFCITSIKSSLNEV